MLHSRATTIAVSVSPPAIEERVDTESGTDADGFTVVRKRTRRQPVVAAASVS